MLESLQCLLHADQTEEINLTFISQDTFVHPSTPVLLRFETCVLSTDLLQRLILEIHDQRYSTVAHQTAWDTGGKLVEDLSEKIGLKAKSSSIGLDRSSMRPREAPVTKH
jgi:hypothetical protein